MKGAFRRSGFDRPTWRILSGRGFWGGTRFRALGAALGLALGTAAPATAEPEPASPAPTQTAESFYAVLLSAMKQGPALGFDGRRRLLDPEIRRDFDLPRMTRLVVGLPWRGLPGEVQRKLVEAFSDFSIANYANEFRDFSGERFVVDPSATALPNGDSIVHTKLYTGAGEAVQLDYLMRQGDGGWQIIDVYLTGTISELAARRSEFSSVLRQEGTEALIKLLQKKTAALSG
jgi:phospholipid transport system substrate-binding protein